MSTRRMRSRSHPRRFIILRSLTGVPTAWLRSARLVSSRPVPTVALVPTAISHVPRASSIPNKTRIKAEGGERGAGGERNGERVRKGERKNRVGTFLSVVARTPLREVLRVHVRTSKPDNQVDFDG